MDDSPPSPLSVWFVISWLHKVYFRAIIGIHKMRDLVLQYIKNENYYGFKKIFLEK